MVNMDDNWSAGIDVDGQGQAEDLLRIAMAMGLDCEHGEGEVRVFDCDRQKVVDWLAAIGMTSDIVNI